MNLTVGAHNNRKKISRDPGRGRKWLGWTGARAAHGVLLCGQGLQWACVKGARAGCIPNQRRVNLRLATLPRGGVDLIGVARRPRNLYDRQPTAPFPRSKATGWGQPQGIPLCGSGFNVKKKKQLPI